MNTTFKLSTIAVVIALGLTACKSNDSHDDVKAPAPITTPTNPTPTEPTNPEPVNPPAPTEPTEPANPPAPTAPTAPANPPAPTAPTEPANPPAPTAPIGSTNLLSPTAPSADSKLANKRAGAQLVDELDEDGNPWRNFKLDSYSAYKTQSKSNSAVLVRNHGNKDEHDRPFVSSDSLYDKSVYVDLNKLTPYFGENRGVWKDDYLTEKNINYFIVNQPYSSYGVLFNKYKEEYESSKPDYYRTQLFALGQKTKLDWLESWKSEAGVGDATYTGKVIATTAYKSKDNNYGFGANSEPTVDGTVRINAHFSDKILDRSYLSGEIQSNKLGRIELPKGDILNDGRVGSEIILPKGNKAFVGYYEAQLMGKGANDIVGSVTLLSETENVGLEIYNAVFGATKQPK